MFGRIRSWAASAESKTSPDPEVDEETYRYSPDGDKRLRRTVLSQLFTYGISEDSPQVQQAGLADLFYLGPRLAAEFWENEKPWIDKNLTSDEQHVLKQSRADHGIGTSYDQPLVDRPMSYSNLAGHSVNSLETAWKLVDRGIEVAKTAMDLHFCYLAGLRAGNLFYDAGNPSLEQTRLSYAFALKDNRQDASEDFNKIWGEPPPNLGKEYDYLEYTQAVNRVANLYRDRDKIEGSQEQAISACHEMISRTSEFKALFVSLDLGLPGKHHGFYQLSVIFDKQRKWSEAIQICKQALQEGWPGDWEVRIVRYERRLTSEQRKRGGSDQGEVTDNVAT